MMRDRVKFFVYAIVWAVVLLVVVRVIDKVLEPKYTYSNSTYPMTSTYDGFYDMDRDSVDVLILGSSVCVNGISPQDIYDECGIRSYNLSSEQQSMVVSYYWLKEALRRQSPQVVVLDSRFLFPRHMTTPLNMDEPILRKSVDPMHMSLNKLSMITDICTLDESQDVNSYIFTGVRFHSRRQELEPQDYYLGKKCSNALKGYYPLSYTGNPDYEPYILSDSDANPEDSGYEPVMREYLDKIAELCGENNIKLMITALPGPEMNDSINNLLLSYEDENVRFYNFAEKTLYDKVGLEGYESILNHANIWGAQKLSKRIAHILADDYGVASVSDSQWEESRTEAYQIMNGANLTVATDGADYLNRLSGYDYTVFMELCGGDVNCINCDMEEMLVKMGMTDCTAGPSFIGIINCDEGTINMSDESYASFEGSFGAHLHSYDIRSSASDPDYDRIEIDGEDYSIDGARGLQVVVYDNIQDKVVDSACITGDGLMR